MAAVEKRKNPWLALLYNHLMLMVICVLTVTLLKDILQLTLGALLSFLYFSCVYDYSQKAGKEHSCGRFETEFSWKFPLGYALIGNLYFWLGIIVNLIGSAVFPPETLGNSISLIFYVVWDAPFIFLSAFSGEMMDKLNILPLVVFTAMFFVSTFLGYGMGKYEKSVRKFTNKLRKNKTIRKALR